MSGLSNRYRRLGLRSRILLLLLPLLLLIAGMVFERVDAMLAAELEQSAKARLRTSAHHAAAHIAEEIQLRVSALELLGRELRPPAITDAKSALRTLTRHPITTLLFSSGLVVADKDARIVADYPHLYSRSGAPVTDPGLLRSLAAGEPYALGTPGIGTYTRKPRVLLGVPLRDDRRTLQGLLLGVISLDDEDVFAAVDQFDQGETDYAMVISPRHRLLVVASDKSRMLQPLPAPGVDAQLDRTLSDSAEATDLTSSWNGVESFTVRHPIANTDWIMVVGVSRAKILVPAAALRRSTYLWAILLTGLSALLLHLALRRELQPLARATRAMAQMTSGAAPFAPLPEGGAAEIGQMIVSFNSLVRERAQADERLRSLNAELEQRVDERTLALSEANLALNREVAQRWSAETQAMELADRLKNMAQRFVETEEAEKRRLARDLHDCVSSSLMAIGLSVGLVQRDLGRNSVASLRERLTDIADLVEDTMFNAREISSDMHPASLDYDGLYGALEDCARKIMARTGLVVRFDCSEKGLRLAPDKETALFRIAQEALMNCVKHAQAKSVEVSLKLVNGRAILCVADDGIGFDMTAAGRSDERPPGLGLLGMGERAQYVGGEFRLESHPGAGTRIIVDVAASLL